MKLFSWFTDGVREADKGRYVLYEEHLAVVEKLKADIEKKYSDGWNNGIEYARVRESTSAYNHGYEVGYEEGARDVLADKWRDEDE